MNPTYRFFVGLLGKEQYKISFVYAQRKLCIAKISIRRLGSLSHDLVPIKEYSLITVTANIYFNWHVP